MSIARGREGVPMLAQSKTSDLLAAVYKCLHNTTTAPEKYRINVLTWRPQNIQNVVEMILKDTQGQRATSSLTQSSLLPKRTHIQNFLTEPAAKLSSSKAKHFNCFPTCWCHRGRSIAIPTVTCSRTATELSTDIWWSKAHVFCSTPFVLKTPKFLSSANL